MILSVIIFIAGYHLIFFVEMAVRKNTRGSNSHAGRMRDASKHAAKGRQNLRGKNEFHRVMKAGGGRKDEATSGRAESGRERDRRGAKDNWRISLIPLRFRHRRT